MAKLYNAVVEGTDVYGNQRYKLVELHVPESATVLSYQIHDFRLYGRTQDFLNVTIEPPRPYLKANIPFLVFCPGILIPQSAGHAPVLELPRAVCMRDGRIFVGSHVEDRLINRLPDILEITWRIFSELGG